MSERSLRNLNLVFRFALELVVLVALFLWGVSVSGELLVRIVLGLGAPALAVAVWALFVAPRASRRLPDPQRLAVEIVVFGAGVLAFLATGEVLLGAMLAAAAAINFILMSYWGQRGR
jgi:K+-sensing histidine kinase KdpD